jgi:hypothetical protein
VLRLALDGETVPLPNTKGKFKEAPSEPPMGSDSLAH